MRSVRASSGVPGQARKRSDRSIGAQTADGAYQRPEAGASEDDIDMMMREVRRHFLTGSA